MTPSLRESPNLKDSPCEVYIDPIDTSRRLFDEPETALAPFARANWLFPGLGCRYVGMGNDLIGQFPEIDRMIQTAEPFLGFDVAEVCLTGSGRKHVPARQEAQVIYLLDCAYAVILGNFGYSPLAVCGHSLGSLAATTVSGALDFLTGLELVTTIEQLLEDLVDGTNQAMGVIIGLDELAIESHFAAHPGVSIANRNSPLQFVIGGLEKGVDGVLDAARQQGAKQARRLGSSRALHTSSMTEVGRRLRKHLKSIQWFEPSVPVVNCHDGTVLKTTDQIQEFLGDFLSQPVQWQNAIRVLRQNWGHEFVECGPGSVLSGMMPFIEPNLAVRTASDILNQKVQ